MRLLSILIFFPFSLLAQDLPDSTLAKKLLVKKLIILKCSENNPCDTEYIYVLDGIWKLGNGKSAYEDLNKDTTYQKVVRDEKGRVIYIGPKSKPEHCWLDSAGGRYFHYDNQNQIIEEGRFSCDKGAHRFRYKYNLNGQVISKTCNECVIDIYSREEFYYGKTGQLDSVVTWMAKNPELNVRDSSDSKVAVIKYVYDKNGLIKEAIANDPMRRCYSISDWGNLEIFNQLPSTIRFRYIYIY